MRWLEVMRRRLKERRSLDDRSAGYILGLLTVLLIAELAWIVFMTWIAILLRVP